VIALVAEHDSDSVLSPASVDEEFLAIICADDELVRAEFDDIIAESWGEVPSPSTGRRPPGGHWPVPNARDPIDPSPPRWRANPGTAWQARQRSPPSRRRRPRWRGAGRH